MKQVIGRLKWLLIGSGIALLILGGVLGYPYVHSRLAGPAPVTNSPTASARPAAAVRSDGPPTRAMPRQTATQRPTHTPDASPLPSPVLVPAAPPTVSAQSPEREGRAGSGMPPRRIVVPSIGVDAPVVQASRYQADVDGQRRTMWDVPDAYAAGWHETSAALGESGNRVLSGHNTNHGEVFRDLYVGDRR